MRFANSGTLALTAAAFVAAIVMLSVTHESLSPAWERIGNAAGSRFS